VGFHETADARNFCDKRSGVREIEAYFLLEFARSAPTGRALVTQGYSREEVGRALSHAVAHGVVAKHGQRLMLRDARHETVRQHLLGFGAIRKLKPSKSMIGRTVQAASTASHTCGVPA
jgi:hypothetical protein